MAFDAKIALISSRGERIIPLADFYTGVRKNVMEADEIVTDIFFDAPGPHHDSFYIKTALRRAQAISVINISVLLEMDDGKVVNPQLTLGAVAPTIIHADTAEEFLAGKALSDEVIFKTAALIQEAASPISDIRGSADYRAYMVGGIAKRALQAIRDGVDKSIIPEDPVLLMGSGVHGVPPKETWNGQEIHTWINGQEYHFTTGFDKTLLDLIREEVGLTGTKEGCAEGECGACTVFLDGRAVMSCLVPAPRAHGSEIITIEGLSQEGYLHPIQQAFVDFGAIQCGFCTPGFIMSATKLLEEHPRPSQMQIRQAITGNLCRCTGYYKIIEAIERAAQEPQARVQD
jgi:carbon-monoxide dehydrogenase medium subunit